MAVGRRADLVTGVQLDDPPLQRDRECLVPDLGAGLFAGDPQRLVQAVPVLDCQRPRPLRQPRLADPLRHAVHRRGRGELARGAQCVAAPGVGLHQPGAVRERAQAGEPDRGEPVSPVAGQVDPGRDNRGHKRQGESALPGGSRFDVKWDGYRAVVIRCGGTARIWSRQRNNLTDRFRDIAAAAVSQLPDGEVLDGELVVSTNGRLDFDALQKRLVTTSPARARQLSAAIPASYVAFDLLAYGGVDLRTQRWATRRSRLEQLAADWSPPLQLTPVTYDLAEAREWFEVLSAAIGVEGLVLKPTAARYAGGCSSSWAKIRSAGVPSVRFAGASGVVPGQRVARRGVVVRDRCRGRAAA